MQQGAERLQNATDKAQLVDEYLQGATDKVQLVDERLQSATDKVQLIAQSHRASAGLWHREDARFDACPYVGRYAHRALFAANHQFAGIEVIS